MGSFGLVIVGPINHDHYTILGRLDQYPRGRGNTFRDMCDSNIFKINFSRHIGAECIENTSIDELASIVLKTWSCSMFFRR